MKISLLSLLLLFSSTFLAQSPLQLKDIMSGDDFIGHQPENAYWSWDGTQVYFDWKKDKEAQTQKYVWRKGEQEAQILVQSNYKDSYLNSPDQADNEIRYYIKDGALFKFHTLHKTHEKIYHSDTRIHNMSVSADQEKVFFQQGDNLFCINTVKGTFVQLTNFKKGKQANKKDEESSFLSEQQQELFEFIRKQKEQDNKSKTDEEPEPIAFPKTYVYGDYWLDNLQITPDENFVLFRLSSYPKDQETSYQNYITSDGYSKPEDARKKVSINGLSTHKLGVLDLKSDSVYFIDFDQLGGLLEEPSYLSLYYPKKEAKPYERKIYMNEAVFNEKGTCTVMCIRSLDNKDRWIVRLDLKNGKIDELEHQNDQAWIGGPGISSWNFYGGTLGFMGDQEQIYYQSEESGYSHLYLMHTVTKKKTQVTSGNWEVRSVQLAKNKKDFYIGANKTHPGNLDFYKLETKSKNLIPLLTADGAHEVELSPDESTLLIRYSYKNKPWELYAAPNKPNTTKTQFTHSQSTAFSAYDWREPEVIRFEAQDKTGVYARVYEAKAGNKNGAAVIFVHGAGYLQNAHNHWSVYHREYMFHNLLADEGYTVLDIDYRASDGYGRDFRTGIYRFMGGLDLSDNMDGRQLLIDRYGIDSNRIGMYGGSYGGFITLMALLNHPGKFACGAALRSVTDWAHYNLEYTSNILNFPETDPEAYRKSSPIYFAENLSDPLLMLHGMVDDNVQFQDVVRLSQRFIELGKTDWNLAVFPVEAHGFKESSSWLDEYRRIHELFQINLK